MQPGHKHRSGWLWIAQAASGIILLGLLGLHMIAQHFVVEGGLRTYSDVLDYIRNPALLIIEMTFLILATYHGLAGLRAILLDLGLSDRQKQLITHVLVIVGAIMILYGLWLEFTLRSRT